MEMRFSIRKPMLLTAVGLFFCTAHGEQVAPRASATSTPSTQHAELKISVSSPNEAVANEFAGYYSTKGFAVTRSTSITETKSSGGWSFSTASWPMFSRPTPSDARTAIYTAIATKSAGGDQAQMRSALAFCNSLVARSGGQCSFATTDPAGLR